MQLKKPDYIKGAKIRNRILNYCQHLPPLSRSYDKYCKNNKYIKSLFERFPDKIIKREDIVNLYKDNNVQLALLATMLWGGIRISHLKLFLDNLKPEKAKDTIKYVREMIKKSYKKDLIELFKQFDNKGNYKIPGVGPSFFTKIFFFVGLSMKNITLKPLIFDKWTKHAYCALLYQSNSETARNYFKSKKEIGEETKKNKGIYFEEIYCNYVKDFNGWARQINGKPEKLEEFVFGYRLNKKGNDNPRKELWDIITKNQ